MCLCGSVQGKVRHQLTKALTDRLGLSLAETGRQLGVSTAAVAKALSRKGKQESDQPG